MSNVALVQIFIPVVFGIATNLGIDPILLGMPVALGASMAFMFPVATPPNAIVFLQRPHESERYDAGRIGDEHYCASTYLCRGKIFTSNSITFDSDRYQS
jgi:hypothetical protein